MAFQVLTPTAQPELGIASALRFIGPPVPFTLHGFSGAQDGKHIFVQNSTGGDMIISIGTGAIGSRIVKFEGNSTVGALITVPTGRDAEFIYTVTDGGGVGKIF